MSIVQVAASLVALDWAQRRALEQAIRQRYGGDEVYIRRTSWENVVERNAAIVAELAAGASVSEVARTYCVSHAWVRRLRVKRNFSPKK